MIPTSRLDEIVNALNGLDGIDQDGDHETADALLCEAIRILGRPDIAKAFEEAEVRVGFWYS